MMKAHLWLMIVALLMINLNGAAFSIDYINQDGGTNFDGYPSGSIGGVRKSGVYYPGNYSASECLFNCKV